jgi:hypothetical protein
MLPSARDRSLEEWIRIVRGEYEESPGPVLDT